MRTATVSLSVAALLFAASAAPAAVQAKAAVGHLAQGNWKFVESGDGVALIHAPLPAEPSGKKHAAGWSVSATTVRSGDGRYLAFDPDGKDRSVRLVKKEGKDTRWAVEVTKWLAPGEECRVRVGDEGVRFRLRVKEGPLKGWYLGTALGVDGPDGARAAWVLRLYKDRADAAEFTFIKVRYWADHR